MPRGKDHVRFVDRPGGDLSSWRQEWMQGRLVVSPSAEEPLPGGWYSLSIHPSVAGPSFVEPAICVDYGEGFWEKDRVSLRALRSIDERSLTGIVLLPRPALRIRFADHAREGGMAGAHVALTRRSRSTALVSMLSGHAGRRAMASALDGIKSLRRHGISGFGGWIYGLHIDAAVAVATPRSYAEWLRCYDRSSRPPRRSAAESHDAEKRFSILLPTYNSNIGYLEACLDSVLAQTEGSWQLCIADDASTDPAVRETLVRYAEKDPRISLIFREENGHISRATNSALALARGEFAVLLDHDDLLHPDALAELANASDACPDWDLIYTDEDKIDERGTRSDPYFKPDFNLDLLRGQNCISHLAAYRRSLVVDIGGMRVGYEGSQDWDLALRFHDLVGAARIGHVPRVLYHWRMASTSTALSSEAKPYARTAALRAIGDHLLRSAPGATVAEIPRQPGNYRVLHTLPSESPKVSVLICSRDQPDLLERCVASILATTSGLDVELLVLDNGSVEARTHAALTRLSSLPGVRIVRDARPFNFSALNNALVDQASGDVLVFVNDDVEATTDGWLKEMVAHALRPEVGAVGAKLYYPNGHIQHAGIFLGVEGIAANAYRGAPANESGHTNRALLAQNLSAVTGACLAMRRDVFQRVGGLDESLPVDYNDVDLCLRIREAGLLVVWTPFAELIHHESMSRGKNGPLSRDAHVAPDEQLMRKRWQRYIDADPAYNVNLDIGLPLSGLGFPPRVPELAKEQPIQAA